jgi:hypothetical protein
MGFSIKTPEFIEILKQKMYFDCNFGYKKALKKHFLG